MKPAPAEVLLDADPLNALFDLAAAPIEGDQKIATWLESQLHDEQVSCAKASDAKAFERARNRTVMGSMARHRICEQLNIPTRKAA